MLIIKLLIHIILSFIFIIFNYIIYKYFNLLYNIKCIINCKYTIIMSTNNSDNKMNTNEKDRQ